MVGGKAPGSETQIVGQMIEQAAPAPLRGLERTGFGDPALREKAVQQAADLRRKARRRQSPRPLRLGLALGAQTGELQQPGPGRRLGQELASFQHRKDRRNA
jgi:hypothetical protein